MADAGREAKDLWEKLGGLSVFLSSVVIAGAGLIINSSYNERQSSREADAQQRQHELSKVQTLSTFMPYLSGTKETREAALYAITALGYPELSIRLGSFQKGETATSDNIMRAAPASVAATVALPAPPAGREEPAWVYLGEFDGGWKTRYLDFDTRLKPENLVGNSYAVRGETGAVNVRAGMPTDNGEFPRVARTLRSGAHVKILEVRQWLTTGYTWARISG